MRPSPILAYVLGVLKGDGSVIIRRTAHGTEYRIQLSVVDEPFANSFCEALKQLGMRPKIYS